jgi:hypothetical protein
MPRSNPSKGLHASAAISVAQLAVAARPGD